MIEREFMRERHKTASEWERVWERECGRESNKRVSERKRVCERVK
jgi:hypothetical protein